VRQAPADLFPIPHGRMAPLMRCVFCKSAADSATAMLALLLPPCCWAWLSRSGPGSGSRPWFGPAWRRAESAELDPAQALRWWFETESKLLFGGAPSNDYSAEQRVEAVK